MLLGDAGRAEQRDRGPVDPRDTLEACSELVGDSRDVAFDVVGARLEEPAVVHPQKLRGTCVSCIANTRNAARPT